MAITPPHLHSRRSREGTPPKKSVGRIALFFALAVSTVVVGSSASPRISHALSSGGLTYQDFDGTGESWEVQGCDGTCAANIVIPSSVDGKPVVSIKHSIFYVNGDVTRVEIPASVTRIGNYAFHYSSITSLVVDSASEHFKVVDNMLLNKAGTELVGYASGNSATSLTIPAGITKLQQGSLSSNTLTSITLPSSLQEIGVQAIDAAGLSTIELPASLSIIGYDAFGSSLSSFTVTAGNTTFSATAGVLFKGSTLLRYPPARSAASYSLPPGTTDIEPEAFRNGGTLVSLDFPASLSALAGASLNGLSNLASITVNAGSTTFSASNGVLFNGSKLIKYPPKKTDTTYSVPPGTVEIGEGAFDGATLVTSVTLPDSLQIIGFNGFARATQLASINLPVGLTTLSSYALYGTAITSIVVPHTVTNWGSSQFLDIATVLDIYFEGDAPPVAIFEYDSRSRIIHRIAATSGWPAFPSAFEGRAQQEWDPVITTPRAPSATALGGSVRVTANRGSGGLPSSYLVTASPGGATCSIANQQTSCVVTGLTAGTPYSFTTTATKGATTTASSLSSATVNPLAIQTISFSDPIDRQFSATPFTVNATSNSNLTVTLTSTTPDVCTVSGFAVSMLTTGTCTLTASEAGNATYAAATDVEHSFQISEAQTTPTTSPTTTVVPTPTVAPTPTTAAPLVKATGTPVTISRAPVASVATAAAVGVSQTKVMIALKVPTASKPANQVTKYIIQLKSSAGAIITRTISVKAGASVSPTLTGKKKTSYSMTVTAVTKSGKKTTWKGPQVKTS